MPCTIRCWIQIQTFLKMNQEQSSYQSLHESNETAYNYFSKQLTTIRLHLTEQDPARLKLSQAPYQEVGRTLSL